MRPLGVLRRSGPRLERAAGESVRVRVRGRNRRQGAAAGAVVLGGLLGAVATISTVRYWAAGFAGGGDSGFAALEGLVRTVAAALFIASWPWLFDSGVRLTNLFTGSLMGSATVVNRTARLLAAGL